MPSCNLQYRTCPCVVVFCTDMHMRYILRILEANIHVHGRSVENPTHVVQIPSLRKQTKKTTKTAHDTVVSVAWWLSGKLGVLRPEGRSFKFHSIAVT